MSWFSELTGKAGALLDKMDQAAATSLQEVGVSTPVRSEDPKQAPHSTGQTGGVQTGHYEPTAFQSLNSPSERGAAVAQVLVGSASGSAQLTSTPRNQNQARPPSAHRGTATATAKSAEHKDKDKSDDDSIFEFLNAPSADSGGLRKTRSTPRMTHTPAFPRSAKKGEETSSQQQQQLQQQKSPPLVSVLLESEEEEEERATKVTASPPVLEVMEEAKEGSVEKTEQTDGGDEATSRVAINADSARDEQPVVVEEEGMAMAAGIGDGAAVDDKGAGSELEEWKQMVSTLQLENRLMKREVSALNEELGGVTLRANQAADIRARYESELHALREQASRSDQVARKLRSREEDFQATLMARDSQIEVLRSQLSAGDRAVEEAKERLLLSKKEQERLVQDVNMSSSVQNQAMDSLKSQLSQALTQLEHERGDREAEKRGLLEKESFLQSERTKLSEDCAALQKQVAAEQRRARDLQSALQSAQRETQTLQKEHEEYKQRAAGILQAKEKLISSLQQSGSSGGEAARMEESRLEREHLQAQLTNALQQLDTARRDMRDFEEKTSVDMDGVLEQVRVCEGVLGEERRQHAGTRVEAVRASQEFEMVREDLAKERTKHREDVEAKDAEIANLTLCMTSLTPGRAELEGRLHELTESLIQKQTTLETLHSEKNTLNVQLQRLQSELAQAHRPQASANSHTSIQVSGPEPTSSDASRIPTMTSVIPSLEHAAVNSRLHNVRRAVNTVDRISIRLGIFLKRYPQARLFVLLYMLLLHVWVMVVMLTYSPEVHDADYTHPGM